MKFNSGDLAQLLKDARLKKDLSQKEVALQLGYSSPQFISNWERGLAQPPLKVLRQLVKIYGLPEKKVLRIILKDFEKRLYKQFDQK